MSVVVCILLSNTGSGNHLDPGSAPPHHHLGHRVVRAAPGVRNEPVRGVVRIVATPEKGPGCLYHQDWGLGNSGLK